MKHLLLAAASAALLALAGPALAAQTQNSVPGNDGAPHADSRDAAKSGTQGQSGQDTTRLTNCGINGSAGAKSSTSTATGNQETMNCEHEQSGSSTPDAGAAKKVPGNAGATHSDTTHSGTKSGSNR